MKLIAWCLVLITGASLMGAAPPSERRAQPREPTEFTTTDGQLSFRFPEGYERAGPAALADLSKADPNAVAVLATQSRINRNALICMAVEKRVAKAESFIAFVNAWEAKQRSANSEPTSPRPYAIGDDLQAFQAVSRVKSLNHETVVTTTYIELPDVYEIAMFLCDKANERTGMEELIGILASTHRGSASKSSSPATTAPSR